jgi:hypothetical protein
MEPIAPRGPLSGILVNRREPKGPLSDILAMKKREEDRRAQQTARRAVVDAPARINEMLRGVLSTKLGMRQPDVPRYSGIANVVPMNEQDVMLRDRQEKMRSAFLQRLRDDRSQNPEAYAQAEQEYATRASRRGKFLKRAYDAVGTPEGYSDFDVEIMRDQGMVSPMLDEYNPMTRERVAKEFQRTHKWARKKENLADLDIAVKYLMSRPNFEQSFYYNP